MIVMKKVILCIFLLFICVTSYSQTLLEVLQNNGVVDSKHKGNLLVMVSSSGCGHCLIALKELQQLSSDLSVVVVDFGKQSEMETLSNLYKKYTFANYANIKGLKNYDEFPILYLYDTRKKLIWQKSGWFSKNLKIIDRKIKKYN